MTRLALLALLAHWRRRKAQLVTLVLGLALATALWSGVQAINAEARAAYARAADDVGAAAMPRILGPEAPDLADFIALRRGGWLVTPIAEGHAEIAGLRLRVLGIDPLTAPEALRPAPLAPGSGLGGAPGTEAGTAWSAAPADPRGGAQPAQAAGAGPVAPDAAHGTAPTGPQATPTGEAAPESATPDSAAPDAAAPERRGAAGSGSANDSAAPLLAAAPELAARIGARPAAGLPPDLVVAELSVAQELLGLGERYSRLAVLADQPLVQAPLESLGPYRLAPAEAQPDLGAMTGSFHLNLTAFGLLAFAVGLFVVQGTIGLAFEERRPGFRTLRALGLPLKVLALALMLELTVLALAGGALGVVLGGLLAMALLPDVSASLAGLYDAAIPAVLSIRPEWWASGMAMALGGTWIAGASALWRLSQLPLMAPARPRAWALASRVQARRLALAGGLLLLVAASIFAFAGSLLAGFAGLGALMLGGAFLLPQALGAGLGFGASRASSPARRWLWADTAQQIPGLSLALAALLLALAANIGVTTMVGSFRSTFTGWLDQRLASELYVSTRDSAEAARFAAWAEPRAAAVLPVWTAPDTVSGAGEITLYGIADHEIYRRNWPLIEALPAVWDALHAASGLLINEQLARRLQLRPGDMLPLGSGQAQVLGVYSDYGNPAGQAIIALPGLLGRYPDTDRRRFGLLAGPDGAAALAAAISADFGLPPEFVTDQAAQKRAALAIFERTFVVTGALNVLTLGVAGFAMFTALITLARMRLPQLAPVWAMGMTRRRLALLDLGRSLALAALTFVLALPLGLVLAWALLSRINVAAFGWRLPMSTDPAALALLLLGALAAAFAAALIPALRLARIPPSQLLRVFSGER